MLKGFIESMKKSSQWLSLGLQIKSKGMFWRSGEVRLSSKESGFSFKVFIVKVIWLGFDEIEKFGTAKFSLVN